MTDNRCPQCNRVVKGRVEVSPGKPKTPAKTCPYCKTVLTLTSKTDELGLCHYYTTATTIVE